MKNQIPLLKLNSTIEISGHEGVVVGFTRESVQVRIGDKIRSISHGKIEELICEHGSSN
jgi:hypothetical protein